MNKTLWQTIYSWFGFWKYYEYDRHGDRWCVIYWCCFPFFFLRKFDLLKFKSNIQHCM